MATTSSLVSKLLDDHREVKKVFSSFDTKGRSHWPELFGELTNMLVRHEVAEEEILYPEVRKALPDGGAIADNRISEQAKAEKLLSDMEKMGPEDGQFQTSLTRLREDVLEHAEKEEQTIFGPLGEAVDAKRLEQLGQLYEKAKSIAPTHPHPNAPDTPPGNVVIGPVAAIVDRFRDAMRKAS